MALLLQEVLYYHWFLYWLKKRNDMTTTLQTALFIALVGIVGIFIFMFIFYLLIKGLDKWFPFEETKPEGVLFEEDIED